MPVAARLLLHSTQPRPPPWIFVFTSVGLLGAVAITLSAALCLVKRRYAHASKAVASKYAAKDIATGGVSTSRRASASQVRISNINRVASDNSAFAEAAMCSGRPSSAAGDHQEEAAPDGPSLNDLIHASPRELYGVPVKSVIAAIDTADTPVEAVMQSLWEDHSWLELVVTADGEKRGSLTIISYRVANGVADKAGEGFVNQCNEWSPFSLDAAAFVSAFRAADQAGIDYIWFNCA